MMKSSCPFGHRHSGYQHLVSSISGMWTLSCCKQFQFQDAALIIKCLVQQDWKAKTPLEIQCWIAEMVNLASQESIAYKRQQALQIIWEETVVCI